MLIVLKLSYTIQIIDQFKKRFVRDSNFRKIKKGKIMDDS